MTRQRKPAGQHEPAARASATGLDVPLCVDLDGTLIRGDLLHEGIVGFLKARTASAWRLPFWAAQGPVKLKQSVAAAVPFDASTLPYRTSLVEYLRGEHSRGREIHLVTASPQVWATQVADHLGVFARVDATEKVNLKGQAKATLLAERHGDRGFDYVGDHAADRPIWDRARIAHRAGAGVRLALELDEDRLGLTFENDGRTLPAALLKAMRPHQWLKNLLLFVPLLSSHLWTDWGKALAVVLAFMSFSLIASATYLLNDLLDLPSDRAHPRKRSRPFASGDLSIGQGLMAMIVLTALSLSILPFLPVAFSAVLAVYTVTTLLYSFRVKRASLADVLVLAGLYTLRIVAGASAASILVSSWLLAFSMFAFISLAVAKRCAELTSTPRGTDDLVRGRGYYLADLEILGGMGSASSFCAVLVLAIYTTQPYVAALYRTPALLWLICPLLLYWLNRILLLARRGHMHDDPVVFSVTDRISLGVLGLAMLIAVVAALVSVDVTLIGVG